MVLYWDVLMMQWFIVWGLEVNYYVMMEMKRDFSFFFLDDVNKSLPRFWLLSLCYLARINAIMLTRCLTTWFFILNNIFHCFFWRELRCPAMPTPNMEVFLCLLQQCEFFKETLMVAFNFIKHNVSLQWRGEHTRNGRTKIYNTRDQLD